MVWTRGQGSLCRSTRRAHSRKAKTTARMCRGWRAWFYRVHGGRVHRHTRLPLNTLTTGMSHQERGSVRT